MHKRNNQAHSLNYCCRGQAISITYSECAACRASTPYCHMWPVYLIFPHYLINSMILGKKIECKMCVLIFCTTVDWNILNSKKNSATFDQKRILVFMYSTGYSGQIVMTLEFVDRFSKNNKKIKFQENSSSGSRQTDRHGATNSRFSQFYEHA
jgi:hypothetical protein